MMDLTQTLVSRESARRSRRLAFAIGEEIHRLRAEAGVSLAAVSAVTGVHKSYLARIEAGLTHASLGVLTSIGVALGADLSLRFFPGAGPRLHDRFQAPMVETLLRVLDHRWQAEIEVPILRPARGVVDVVLTDRLAGTVIACEAYSELRRLEQQIRWSREKADGLAQRLVEAEGADSSPLVSRLLILRSTVATRDLARRYESTLDSAYPGLTHGAILALTTQTAPWSDPAVVWMHLHGSTASLMRFPPRGVSLGRDRFRPHPPTQIPSLPGRRP